VCEATEVPDRSSCFPRTATSTRFTGKAIYSRITDEENALVRSRISCDIRICYIFQLFSNFNIFALIRFAPRPVLSSLRSSEQLSAFIAARGDAAALGRSGIFRDIRHTALP
jgi:hypothetical protein